jgi:hypothetical protein
MNAWNQVTVATAGSLLSMRGGVVSSLLLDVLVFSFIGKQKS